MITSNLCKVTNTGAVLRYTVLVTVLLLQTLVLSGQNKYPDWFLYPQKYPNTIIGYSTAGVLTAEKDAVWRYSYEKEGFLTGSASFFNDEDKWEKKYILEAQVPLLMENQLSRLASIPTSFYGGGEEIALFNRNSQSDQTSFTFEFDYPANQRPKWVVNGPFYVQDGYFYGVGQYILRGNENDAWRTAEERALIEIATVVGVDVSSTTTMNKTDQTETIHISTYTFDHEFKNAQVMERWVDYSKKDQQIDTYIYVLMRIESQNIKYKPLGEK